MWRDIAGRSQEPGTSTFGLTQVPEVALLTSGSSQNPRNTPVVASIKKEIGYNRWYKHKRQRKDYRNFRSNVEKKSMVKKPSGNW